MNNSYIPAYSLPVICQLGAGGHIAAGRAVGVPGGGLQRGALDRLPAAAGLQLPGLGDGARGAGAYGRGNRNDSAFVADFENFLG